MSSDSDIKSSFHEHYRYAHDYWAPFITDSQKYTLAASGYTWTNEERKRLSAEGRDLIEYNLIRRPLQFFSGYLRDNINQIIYSPVEGSDQKTADQFTKLSYYLWDKGQGYAKFLDAADEGFKSGIALCGIQMDYSRDFVNGDIAFFNRTYNSFYLDPTFSEIDLSDCGFAITRDLFGKEQLKALLPFVDEEEIDSIPFGYSDDKFLTYDPNFRYLSNKNKVIAYDQYYRRTSRTRKFLVDIGTGFYRDITEQPKEKIDELKRNIRRLQFTYDNAEDFGIERRSVPRIEIRDVERPYVELHILLNGIPVYSGEDKTGVNETFPFAPLICYLEPSIWSPSQRLQGIASCNYSMQRQFNKRHMKIVDMMDSTISTGWKYLIGSVPDEQDLQQTGQNRVVGVDPENAPQGLDSVQELKGGSADPSIIQYQKILDDLSLTLSNVTESALGIDEGGNTQVSGRLAQVRIAQGLRGNRKIFDNVETAQQVLGKIILRAIQSQYPPGKVERILGEEPTQEFYDSQFDHYDAVIKEGIRSQSQRDAYFYELVNLKRDGIVDVPESEIIKSLAMAGLSDLEEAIEKQEEAKAAQQQKVDEQERMALELGNSQKVANLSLSKEREARVLADIGLAEERSSEATSNLADATLARAKTMAEISNLNEDRILKVYAFMEQLHKEEAEAEALEEQKNKARAESIDIKNEIRGSSPSQQHAQSPQSPPSLANNSLSSGGEQ